jgi:spermidine/putrescine transport system permease protein
MRASGLQSRAAFWVSLAPPLFWLVAFFIVPLGIVWLYSFGENANLTDVAITGTIANYARAVEPLYLGIVLKSLWFAALTTILCLVIGFPVALAIAFAKPRLKLWLLIAVMLPFWTNMLIRTYALMAVLRPFDLLHSNFAVMFGLVYVELPFIVLPLYATLERMDRSLLEASLDLGAGHWTTFSRIVVPLAMPGILSGVLITFIPSLGSYLTPDLLGGSDSQMIANVIEGQFKEANNWPFGAALSFLLMYLTFFCIAARSLLARKRP